MPKGILACFLAAVAMLATVFVVWRTTNWRTEPLEPSPTDSRGGSDRPAKSPNPDVQLPSGPSEPQTSPLVFPPPIKRNHPLLKEANEAVLAEGVIRARRASRPN